VQQITGLNLGFEAHPRADIDAIFVAGYQPLGVRQINSQLRYYNAGDIPTYIVQDGFDPDDRGKLPSGFLAAGYDAVLVGSGVRAGSWHKNVKQWVAENADALKSGKVAFYTTCLTMAAEPDKAAEVRAYTDALIAGTGVEPVDVGLFAGWYEPKQFSFVERTILKMMKSPEGDFRDWDAVDAWTRDMAVQLAV